MLTVQPIDISETIAPPPQALDDYLVKIESTDKLGYYKCSWRYTDIAGKTLEDYWTIRKTKNGINSRLFPNRTYTKEELFIKFKRMANKIQRKQIIDELFKQLPEADINS